MWWLLRYLKKRVLLNVLNECDCFPNAIVFPDYEGTPHSRPRPSAKTGPTIMSKKKCRWGLARGTITRFSSLYFRNYWRIVCKPLTSLRRNPGWSNNASMAWDHRQDRRVSFKLTVEQMTFHHRDVRLFSSSSSFKYPRTRKYPGMLWCLGHCRARKAWIAANSTGESLSDWCDNW